MVEVFENIQPKEDYDVEDYKRQIEAELEEEQLAQHPKRFETENGATIDELKSLLGRGRAKKGMFEGDLVAGELEIGQISGLINEVKPASEIVSEILTEYRQALSEQSNEKFNF